MILPVHPEAKVTKLRPKISQTEVDQILPEGIDIQTLSKLLSNDISEVRDYVRTQIVTKSVTKSVTKFVELTDFLKEEKTRAEILEFLELANQTKNFNTNIRPLIEAGILEMAIPEKPNSRIQKHRLTEKAKQFLKE